MESRCADNRSAYFNNQKAVAESLNIVMIMAMPSPPDHVQGVVEAVDFHAMKVMQKKNEKETAWIKALKAALIELKAWCVSEIKMGPTWNASGQEAQEYIQAFPIGSGQHLGGSRQQARRGLGKKR